MIIDKYLKVFLIITVLITNFFSGINFADSAASQTSSLSKGLIAHFPLNRATMQSSTTFKDTTPYARTGTITVGGSAGLSPNQKNLAGEGYDFDGNDTKIDTGSDFIGTQALTFSAWVYLDNYGEQGNNAGRVFDNGQTWIRMQSSSARFIFSSNGETNSINSFTNTAPLNTWIHVLVTRTSAGTANFYINSVRTNTTTNSGTPVAGTENVIIGNNAAQTQAFDGRIFDIRVWNRVLTATEVKNLYKSYGPVVQTSSLDKGLIANFPLNRSTMQSATTFKDTTPYARTGTSANAISLVADQKGLTGGAMDFNGTTDVVLTNLTSNSQFLNGFTISVWVKPDNLGEASTARIVDKSNDASTCASGFCLYMGGTNQYAFRVNGAPAPLTANNAVVFGQWSHVLVTVSSGALVNFYVNNVRSGNANQAANALSGITTGNALAIGNYSVATTRTFDGSISDARIYNRVLTADERTDLYKSYGPAVQTNSLDKGLMANFPLNRSTMQSATTFKDITPYARTGTITAGSSAGLSTDQKGLPGEAYDFHNTTTYITLPASNVLIPNANAVTISVWAKSDGDADSDDYIFGFQRSSGSTFMSLRGMTGASYISWIYANNTNGVVIGAGTKNIDDNAWHHYVYIRNGSNLTGYVDGVQDFTTANAGQSPSSNVANIGSFNNTPGSFSFEGQIADFRVYNRVLSIAEIKKLYKGRE